LGKNSDRFGEKSMFRMTITFQELLRLVCLAALIACTDTTHSAAFDTGPAEAAFAAPALLAAQQDDFDACSLFSAADASRITGTPMKPALGNRPKRVCMYEEVTTKPNSVGPGRVALTVNKRNSSDAENRAWSNLKVVRRLQVGEKNIQPLGGMGDEAWFDGHIEKGKVGVASILVRKGSSDFMLDNMVLEYRSSPDAMKAIAKRVAGQL
jgi:hypothetical protein